jgi:tetratricopeptide (TPR) repeat protein
LAHHHKGEYDNAIADYTEAMCLDPKYALAYRSRGLAHFKKGEYDNAIADYTEAIRLDPKDAQAYCCRGLAHAEKGEHDKAIADYTEANRLDPKYRRPESNSLQSHVPCGDDTLRHAATNFRPASQCR